MKSSRSKSVLRVTAVVTVLLSATAVAGTRDWLPPTWVTGSAVGRLVARAVAAPRLAFGGFPAPLPGITAAKTAAFPAGGDVDNDGKADPGDRIRYTVTIANSGGDAAGVHLLDTPDPNTTLDTASVAISPLALNDTYASVGNMTLTSAAIGGSCGVNPLYSVTCGDTLRAATLSGFGAAQGTASGTAPGGTVTTANGGSVLLNADGTFVYNPAAGFEGADSFFYTLSNAAGADTAQVTINVGGANGMVWFVTSGGGGTGRQSNPISLDGFRAINNGSGSNPAANDTIFLFEGAHSLASPLTLLAAQKLIGQDATAPLSALSAPGPQSGNAYPAVLNPTSTDVSITSAAVALTLGSGNTLAGFRIGNSTLAISGSAAGTVQVRDVTIATNGQAMSLSGATFSSGATYTGFTSVTSTGGAAGVSLTNVDGTLALGSGDLSGNAGTAFNANGGNASITYTGTIRNSGGRQVSIVNKTGGTVTFSGALSGTGTGVLLDNNDQSAVASIVFSGGVVLNTGTNAAFTASNGGQVVVCDENPCGIGAPVVNTLTSSTGTALTVSGTTIGSNGLTFRSISANGAANGIFLQTTGTSGGLTVTGNGGVCTIATPTCTGGQIQNAAGSDGASAGNGIYLSGASNVSLKLMHLNGHANNAIYGSAVTGLSIDQLLADGNNGTSNSGAFAESVVQVLDTFGTVSVTNSTLNGGAYNGFLLRNTTSASGALLLTLTGNTVSAMQGSTADVRNTALQAIVGNTPLVSGDPIPAGGGTISATITNNNLTYWWGNAIHLIVQGNSSGVARITGNTAHNTSGALAASGGIWVGGGTLTYLIESNSVRYTNGTAISADRSQFGTTMQGSIVNNTVGVSGQVNSGSATGTGIFHSHHGAGTTTSLISANVIRNVAGSASGLITSVTGDAAGFGASGTINLTISGNNIQETGSPISSAQHGILITHGTSSSAPGDSDVGCYDIVNNTIANLNTSGLPTASNRIRVNQRFGTTSRFPGYTGTATGTTSTTDLATYLLGRNTATNALNANSSTGGFLNTSPAGSGCAQPASVPTVLTALHPVGTVLAGNAPAGVAPAATLSALRVATAATMAALQTSAHRAARLWNDLPSAAAVPSMVLTALSNGLDAARLQLSATLEAAGAPATASVDEQLATLPAAKTVTVVFEVTVNAAPVASYSNQATVSGANFATVTTNTATTAGDLFDTTTALASSLNPAFQGDSIVLTATVTPSAGAITPDGTVQFKDGGANLGSAVACADAGATTCAAQLTTTTLPTGTRSITAEYLGGTNHDPSTSNTVSQVNAACTANPVVTSNADAGPGTLRQAISDACGGTTISFSGVAGSIALTSGTLALSRNVTLEGPGANVLSVTGTGGAYGIFTVTGGTTATIGGLTVSGGNAGLGGGIYNDNSYLTVRDSTIAGNTAQNGGGIFSRASVGGSLTVINTTMSGNSAEAGLGGGIYSDGLAPAAVSIVNSTITGNTAMGSGGGLYYNGHGTATIVNSTITANRSDRLAEDSGTGGGVMSVDVAPVFHNTIVAGNLRGGSGSTTNDDVAGALDAASSHNLIGDGTGMIGVGAGINGNQVGTIVSPIDPRLAPLASNGGTTRTHALLIGSPAIEAGDNSAASDAGLTTDQRGAPRVRDAADADTAQTVDIGAVEADPTIEDITDKATAEDTPLAFTFNVGDAATAFDSITATSTNTALVPNLPANISVTGSTATRTLNLAPAANQFGTSTITVTLTRLIGAVPVSSSDSFQVTVTPTADTPAVTGATTVANRQTTSGLVITANAGDGGEVTHFKIGNITGGALFQADGTTAVADGAFITTAQGSAGLAFTPTTGSIAAGGFDVQAALGTTTTGISAAAHATVTVSKHTTTTTIVSDLPDPSERNQPFAVAVTVASTTGGPTPGGTVAVTDGTNNCSVTLDAQAQGSCTLTTAAAATYTLTATYSGDAVSLGSAGTDSHEVLSCPLNAVVTSIADSGPGTLRQAIADACSTDTITFGIGGAGPHTIALASGLTIDKNLTITGPANAHLVVSGDAVARVFDIAPATTVAISQLTVSDGAAADGAAVRNAGTLTILDSTLSANHAANDGGAVSNSGTLTIANSTLSGNTAARDGGALLLDASGTATITNVTITGNAAAVGAGIRNSGALNLRNSIVTGNSGPVDVEDTGSATTLLNNLLSGDAQLGALQDNGGVTFTHALLAGSPAIDAGDNASALAAGLTTDQRGVVRAADGPDADLTDTVDIGAFEASASLAPLAGASINEDGASTFTIDIGDADLVTSVTGVSSNTALVPNANIAITGTGATRSVTVTPAANTFGTSTITLTVNSGAGTMSSAMLLSVAPVADTAQVSGAATAEDTQTTSGLVVAPSAVDGAEVTAFKITGISGGTLFQHDGVTPIASGTFVTAAEGSAGLRFTPSANATANGQFTVQASLGAADAGLGGLPVTATITVNSAADTPSVTNATTNEDTQTSSGLVISRNASDGAEVTHFKITGISGGALFQNDGTTAIAANSFITAAEAASGLRFTPAADSTATGHFTAQASESASDAGLGGNPVTADITVVALGDAPVVANIATSEDVQTGLITIARNAADGAEVTHFAISAIANGTLFQADGTTAVADGDVITVAQGAAGLKLTPAADFHGNASFAVRSATSASGAGTGAGSTSSIIVSALADTPSATSATTNEDTQSASGLVVTRNTADGAEVTHFKITGVSGGTLYQNDGTTAIAAGSFITAAQGAAGLKFTPAANAIAAGAVTVQASLSALDAGLGGAPAVATITIDAIADAPGVTNASTNEDVVATGLVLSRNPADGAEVTHFRISAIANGALFHADGTTPIADDDVITVAAGNAGLRFRPAADFFGTASFAVQGATSASGTGTGAGATTTITVNAVADTPSITNAATPVNVQTASGLVITRNAADGAEVTHLKISAISGGTLFKQDGTTAIGDGAFITAGEGNAGLRFTPAVNSSAAGHITVQASLSGSDAGLGGTAVTADITVTKLTSTTAVVSSTGAANPGQPITFTATVAPAALPGPAVGGTVQFKDNGANLGAPVTLATGVAALTTSALNSGAHIVTAEFGGDALFASSAGTLAGGQFVRTATTTTLTAAPSPSTVGSAVTLTAAVTPVGGTGVPTGTVTIREGTTTIGTGTLSGGIFTLTTSAFTSGTHPLAADYGGDTTFAPSAGALGHPVGCPAIAVSPATLPLGIIYLAYAPVTFSQTGATSAVTYTLTGALPAGLTMTGGVLSGTPTDAGTFPLTLSAADGNGCVATVPYTLQIGGGRIVTVGSDAPGVSLINRMRSGSWQAVSGPTAAFAPFPGFTGGVRVAEADITGDGIADILAANGPGLAPQVRVFDGATGALVRTIAVTSGAGSEGVFVAAGDVDGDGQSDIIAGIDGGSPVVRVFSGASGAPIFSFTAFAPGFSGGVRLAAGDVNGDGFADIIAGMGPGGIAQVRIISGATHQELRAFTPYPAFVGGIWVAAGDVDGDGYADVITGADAGGGPHVRVFDGRTGAERTGFFAGGTDYTGGVRVAAGDVNGDDRADIITAFGAGETTVRVFDGVTHAMIGPAATLAPAFAGGTFVSSDVPANRMVIDAPAAGATIVGDRFRLSGWAMEQGGTATGVDAVHVWAYPVAGGSPIFAGTTSMGIWRADIDAIFGAQYGASGFSLDVATLPEGTYDLVVYARSGATHLFNMQRTVRVTLRRPVHDVRLAVDVPTAGAIRSNFRIAGWALNTGHAGGGSGIDAVHVWAQRTGGPATFLGAATLGDARADVAAAFGASFDTAGYHLDVSGLADGEYTLMVFGKALALPAFTTSQTVKVTVTTPVPRLRIQVDLPAAGSPVTGAFRVAGWALVQDGLSAPGIDVVHVWAYPVGGGAARFLGAATLSQTRPDVGAVYGSEFATSGFNLDVTGLAPGTYDLAIFARPTGGSFGSAQTVRVTVR